MTYVTVRKTLATANHFLDLHNTLSFQLGLGQKILWNVKKNIDTYVTYVTNAPMLLHYVIHSKKCWVVTVNTLLG